MFWLFFCERFCTSCCISPTNLKKLTFSGKIVGLLKYVGEIQQLVRKHAQKNNHNVIFHYILLPIYPLDFTKFCPIQKKQKTLRNCRYLVKATLVLYLIFKKLILFETLIIFLEPTLKFITRIFDMQK